jgi:hypothetical protein
MLVAVSTVVSTAAVVVVVVVVIVAMLVVLVVHVTLSELEATLGMRMLDAGVKVVASDDGNVIVEGSERSKDWMREEPEDTDAEEKAELGVIVGVGECIGRAIVGCDDDGGGGDGGGEAKVVAAELTVDAENKTVVVAENTDESVDWTSGSAEKTVLASEQTEGSADTTVITVEASEAVVVVGAIEETVDATEDAGDSSVTDASSCEVVGDERASDNLSSSLTPPLSPSSSVSAPYAASATLAPSLETDVPTSEYRPETEASDPPPHLMTLLGSVSLGVVP